MPEISIVITSRNDDHGGGLIYRMRLMIDCLAQLSKKYGLEVELIVVEWNPPQNKPPLKDAIDVTTLSLPHTVRFIVVPPHVHSRFPESDRFPVLQYIAKNVGIRRARGNYIISTNADIVFSDSFFAHLKSERFNEDAFYRAYRYDVVSVPFDATLEGRMEFCHKEAKNIYEPANNHSFYSVSRFIKTVMNVVKALGGRIPDKINTHAAGDFVLISRKWWHYLRGYPELPSHAYVDGLICYMAASIGLKQVVLKPDKCVYHIEHAFQWNRMTEIEKASYRANIDYAEYRDYCLKMLKDRTPLLMNGSSWGLGNETLDEY